MLFNLWLLVIGAILVLMALAASILKRLPLTASILYLAIGYFLGPAGVGLLHMEISENALLIEWFTEIAIMISLFSAGLKLRTPLTERRWELPVRLAVFTLILTIALITLVGVTVLRLPLGAALLLGAILAPTDPVLASDVVVEDPRDQDRLRFSLTGEAGLNEGFTFPFVLLGLGLLGLHELGGGGWRWLAIDVLWAVSGGLIIGWVLGTLTAKLVIYLRREHREAVGLDDFLALGLIAFSFGVAEMAHAYGVLAVFAAGLALRREERRASDEEPEAEIEEAAEIGEDEEIDSSPEKVPAYMARAVLGFTEQLEDIALVAVVVTLGSLLATRALPLEALWFAPLLFLVIRPIAVALGMFRAPSSRTQEILMAWFGIRGMGSIFYLMYAVVHGLPSPLVEELVPLVLYVVAFSVVVHGILVTPLMRAYQERIERDVKRHGGEQQADVG